MKRTPQPQTVGFRNLVGTGIAPALITKSKISFSDYPKTDSGTTLCAEAFDLEAELVTAERELKEIFEEGTVDFHGAYGVIHNRQQTCRYCITFS